VRIEIDPDSSTPVFQQICDAVVGGVAEGSITPGSHLPPVRHLAADLDVAANTVAKAYKQLALEGHVRTRGRNGTVVLPQAPAGNVDECTASATAFVDPARRHGLSVTEAVGVVRRLW